jgi:hypothetical protein
MPEHLSHGAAIAVPGLGADGDGGADGGQHLQALARGSPIGTLGSLGGVNASQADRQSLGIATQAALPLPDGADPVVGQ